MKWDFGILEKVKMHPIVRAAIKYRLALIVLLFGVLLLLSGGLFDRLDNTDERADLSLQPAFDLAAFQLELQQQLEQIDGVGRVSLLLSLEQTEESVYASDVRRSSGGENSESYEKSLSVLSDGSYGEEPVTVTRRMPDFRGAIVLCEGAERAGVRYDVTQAVSAACGIGSDRVRVLKMKKAE